MASSKFFIVEKENCAFDAVIQSLDKKDIGIVIQCEAPVGHYLKCNLDKHWIVTDEEYKLIKQLKK